MSQCGFHPRLKLHTILFWLRLYGLGGFLLFEEDGVGMSTLRNSEKIMYFSESYTISHSFEIFMGNFMIKSCT